MKIIIEDTAEVWLSGKTRLLVITTNGESVFRLIRTFEHCAPDEFALDHNEVRTLCEKIETFLAQGDAIKRHQINLMVMAQRTPTEE